MSIERTVLFVSYNFPPHGGAGVQRSAKFVKFLPEFGWRPVVLTTTEDASLVQDKSLLNSISSETTLVRVPAFSIWRLLRKARTYKLGRVVVALNLLLQVPDAALFWARKARSAVAAVIEQESPQVVYTTSGPFSSHLIGSWVRKNYGIPWLADFRDPWSENLQIPYLPGYRRLNRAIERQVLETADRVASVSAQWQEGLRDNCDGCPDGKFIVIPNGYDDDDVEALPFPERDDRFVLTYIGSFYRTRRPDLFVAAVDHLLDTGLLSASKTVVRFVGANVRDAIPDRPPFEVRDYVPHTQLQEVRSETDALLLILSTVPENAGTPSGKIYEYIASNRPILAIVPEGGVAQNLIEETRTGIAVGDDVPAISKAIESMYRQWQAGFPTWDPDWEVISKYSRRNLTKRLAQEFDEMVAEACC